MGKEISVVTVHVLYMWGVHFLAALLPGRVLSLLQEQHSAHWKCPYVAGSPARLRPGVGLGWVAPKALFPEAALPIEVTVPRSIKTCSCTGAGCGILLEPPIQALVSSCYLQASALFYNTAQNTHSVVLLRNNLLWWKCRMRCWGVCVRCWISQLSAVLCAAWMRLRFNLCRDSELHKWDLCA